MNKKNKGLTDMQEGEFILNESGTAVSTDQVEGVDVPLATDQNKKEDAEKKENKSSAGDEEKDFTD